MGSQAIFGGADREQHGTLLHDAMLKLFHHQHNIEQSQEKYQNDFMHRDVEVIQAALSSKPMLLQSLWRIKSSMEVEPITQGLLRNIWTAATENEQKNTIQTMNIHDFEIVAKKFMLESQEQSSDNMHRDLQVAMRALRNIVETSLAREQRTDEFAKQFAEELRHRLKQAGVWLQWQEKEMKKYVSQTFHIFDDHMDQLVIGILQFFDDQREKMLRTQNQVCICISDTSDSSDPSDPSDSSINETNKGRFKYAVTSSDPVAGRPVVMYADPERVPRVESLELLIAHVGISNITLSSAEEIQYHDRLMHNNLKKKQGSRSLKKEDIESKKHKISQPKTQKKKSHPGLRDTTGLRVVHVDEFCKWFLPAIEHVFTVQNLITESGSAFPDVCSLFPKEERQSMPSFIDEPSKEWYVNLTKKGEETPLKVNCPLNQGGEELHRGTVKLLKEDGTYTFSFDKMGNQILPSVSRTLTKWQLVEYGVFDFRTKDTRNMNKETIGKAQSSASIVHNSHNTTDRGGGGEKKQHILPVNDAVRGTQSFGAGTSNSNSKQRSHKREKSDSNWL
jgi:hypothetical protein